MCTKGFACFAALQESLGELFAAAALMIALSVSYLFLPIRRYSTDVPPVSVVKLLARGVMSYFSFLSVELQQRFRLTQSFVNQLEEAVSRAPVNARTGRRELMFTIFDERQLALTRNCLCSSRSVGLPENYHLFIAMDTVALSGLLPLCPSTLFLNMSGRGFRYDEFCRVKAFVHLLLLSWDIETTVCDNDLVFLQNPRFLFREESDFEAMVHDGGYFEFSKGYPWWSMNVGFMRCLPSELGIAVYQRWLVRMMENMGPLDQDFLQAMLRPRFVRSENATAWFDLSNETSRNEAFRLRYYDPFLVQNGDMMIRFRRHYARIARIRGIKEPYLCHLSFVIPRHKIRVLVDSGLWFVTPGNDKCGAAPDKRFYRSWKEHS
jgi:hypothetical protein